MCGILAILGSHEDADRLRKRALLLSSKLRHRGPDWSGICVQQLDSNNGINILAHERLAIVDPLTGAQPLYNENGFIALTVNGEIWNHKDLRNRLKNEHQFATGSDCEPIVHLYEEFGDQFVSMLDGFFAFVISDKEKKRILAARDPIGVCPLYIGWGRDGSIWFASEMKALVEDCERFEEFPPGHYWSSNSFRESSPVSSCSGSPSVTGSSKEANSSCFHRWYTAPWTSEEIPSNPVEFSKLREALERSVSKRLMTDVPYGLLLSGGLDSSLIAAITCRLASRRIEDHGANEAWWPRVHTFSIGMHGSPDLDAAAKVAKFLGTVHHEIHFTAQEGIDALSDVIYYIETYDVTTVRASIPMFLLSRKIKSMGIKMVLSGEGADEVFGGYLYFHKAPSPAMFHIETCHKLKALSKYDCLRANKSTSAWGVEFREPFLDLEFLDIAMSIDPREKMINLKEGRMEKYILRKAFDDREHPYLPDSVLWRQKEQFSDGVGYGWIDSLKEYANSQVTEDQMKTTQFRFPYNTPMSKEAYLYRSIFHSHFPQECAAKTVPGGPSIACSTATAISWEKSWANHADPSGRSIVDVHLSTQK